MARTHDDVVQFYLERGQDLMYVRKIAVGRDDEKLQQYVEGLIVKEVEKKASKRG